MRTVVYVSFNYGGWYISFKKEIELPFTPFPGLTLTFDETIELELDNHDRKTTTMSYDIEEGFFRIDVRQSWKGGVSDETVYEEIESFTKNGWERLDNTDVPALIELMKRHG